jgi:1,4-dihydroxy-2-naphthoate octaprenyltransferase
MSAWALAAFGSAPAAIAPVRAVTRAAGRELVPVLVATARLQVAFGALLTLGLWIGGVSAS